MSINLRHLIKENKEILPTYTKIGSTPEILVERKGFEYVKNIGFLTPDIVSYSDTHLTTTLISGCSVFKQLESIALQRNNQLLFSYLDHLCSGILQFQEHCNELDVQAFHIYDVTQKLTDVEKFMVHTGMQDSAELISKVKPMISDYFSRYATVPFRDATPKNYIELTDKNTGAVTSASFKEKFCWIDFSSVDQLTLPADDFVSILYHYMIPDRIRKDLLEKYDLSDKKEELMIAKFMRLSRFWVRRRYYEYYVPDLFKTRYPYEYIDFYERQLLELLRPITRLL